MKTQIALDCQRERSRAVCHVLREDVGLAEVIPPTQRHRATNECIAAVAEIPRGRWSGQKDGLMPNGIGLLVLRGLLIRRLGISGGHGAELLGEEDLLRPWQGDDAQATLPQTTGWQVLEPARVAVLDRRVATRLSRYPELTGRLVERALQRSRNLAVNMAIVHQARVHVRLHMLLWHLADRWGRVGTEGVTLPLGLTHRVLADLVAARRPTVSAAMSDLSRRDLVRQVNGGFLLVGEPPGELLELQPVAVKPVDRRISLGRT